MFHLTYYGGISYKEIYNMPVSYKRWLCERIVKELEKKGGVSGAARDVGTTDPEGASLMGIRNDAPARLQRF